MIGRRFPDNEELRAALAGKVAVEIKKLIKPEHRYENELGTLAEVYIPIFSKESGEVRGVLEIYKTPVRLFTTIRRGRIVIWTISLAGGLALHLVLLPLVKQVYGRKVKEETLRTYAQRLEQEVAERTAQLQREHASRNQSEKLAAMASLLAGVAHELNNPLSVVVGQTALLWNAVADGPLAARARKITQATERCARIVRNFLALARQRPPEKQKVDLNKVLEETIELMAYSLRVDTVETSWRLAENLPILWADPHQLQQVIINLVTNAHHAMRDVSPPRRLTLTTRLEAAQGRVLMEVADTGPGVPAEIQERIFEPFFTTKPQGQGTGLGLSLCKGMIEAHGGSIRVESRPGRGTTFVVELPIVELPMWADAVSESGASAWETVASVPGKRILVVDDESEVAEVLAEMLTMDGHEVRTASSGIGALDEVRERRYDLIVTDMKMPGLEGPALYRELVRRHPELQERIIFFTGDTLSPETRDFLEETGAPTLRKPFAVEEVRAIVGRVLLAPESRVGI